MELAWDLLTSSWEGGGGRSAANCHNHIKRSLKPRWLSKREEKWRIWSFLYHLSFILHHQTETCNKLEGESKESHREKKNVNMVIFYGTFIILYQAAVTQWGYFCSFKYQGWSDDTEASPWSVVSHSHIEINTSQPLNCVISCKTTGHWGVLTGDGVLEQLPVWRPEWDWPGPALPAENSQASHTQTVTTYFRLHTHLVPTSRGGHRTQDIS